MNDELAPEATIGPIYQLVTIETPCFRAAPVYIISSQLCFHNSFQSLSASVLYVHGRDHTQDIHTRL